MDLNVVDAMGLVSAAVAAELDAMELSCLLEDDATITLRRTSERWPCRSVWCQMTVQAEGVIQPLEIEASIDRGRLIGDHNAFIRAMVRGAIAFAARHEVLVHQAQKLRSDIAAVIAEAKAEGLPMELIALDRLPINLMDVAGSDLWQVRMRMLDRLGDRISCEEIRVPVHTLETDSFGARLRSWLPEQRALHRRRIRSHAPASRSAPS